MKFPAFNRSRAVKALTTTSSATWLGMGAPGVPMVDGDSREYSLGSLVAGLPDGSSSDPVRPSSTAGQPALPLGVLPDRAEDVRPRRSLEAWEQDLG